MMPQDGLYIFDASNASNVTSIGGGGDALFYDSSKKQFQVLGLNDGDVRDAAFYVHHMADHSSYEIHSAREDLSLRATSSGKISLGKKDTDEHASYRWKFHKYIIKTQYSPRLWDRACHSDLAAGLEAVYTMSPTQRIVASS
jgi:hypothetical protein